MNLEEKITLLANLKDYLQSESDQLNNIKRKAFEKNKWFIEEFVNFSFNSIVTDYLDYAKLNEWIHYYHIDDNIEPKKIGIVMAGNIPLVGFHDFLCAFITGHHQFIKLSDKDDLILKHLIDKLFEWNPKVGSVVKTKDNLKDCEAYIATGSNNSERYFKYYFGKYPSVIRHNKTSVAILSGNETYGELTSLADDVYTYFGLGCRNVTKLFVPRGYDFVMLLNAFKKYDYLSEMTKYKNNYDYNLALLIMNNKYYMSNESIVLSENDSVFSPVSMLHYSYYDDRNTLVRDLGTNEDIQCIVSNNTKDYILNSRVAQTQVGGDKNINRVVIDSCVSFGNTQKPGLYDYADGIDTMQFLLAL
ncbi:MAG: acyl-CoA reductase [Ginsengibacter sp.]